MHLDHDHTGLPHDHDHPHTHEHTHDGVTHTHEHVHDHEHNHHHDHDCQGSCGTCPSQCEHTPMEELTALMKYMVGHNAAHAKELAELAKKLDELKKDLFMLRMQHATNQLDNPMQIAAVKKDIARIKTIIREKETNV